MIISRREALERGLKWYYTGKQCSNGHTDRRQTSNGCCKKCAYERSKKYSEQPNAKLKKSTRKIKNSEHIKQVNKKYRENNKDSRRKYLDSNRVKISESLTKYYNENRKSILEYRKKWYLENKDKAISSQRLRYQRVKDDPDFKLTKSLRQMLRRIILLTGQTKKSKTYDILGYNSKDLKRHLESLFTDGMSWDNYGEWHIDHIVPVSWWLKNDVTDPAMINSLINLQPLWAKDNMLKSDKC